MIALPVLSTFSAALLILLKSWEVGLDPMFYSSKPLPPLFGVETQSGVS